MIAPFLICYASFLHLVQSRLPLCGIEYTDRKEWCARCAIAGVIGVQVAEQVQRKMEHTMRRRGPDSKGCFRGSGVTLLHSRLVIVDPEGGVQPMELEFARQTYTIVYNGELYNTRQIRQELVALGHCFKSYSDTEVLLHAYGQWKEHCLEKLNGIFGFAVWEHQNQKLFIARDRIGVKPLFYAQIGETIVFASEIKTILASGLVQPRLDIEGASQLILLGPGRIPGSGVFRDIKEVKPGHYGVYQNGKLTIRRYWKLTDREHTDSFEETAEKVRWLVTDAITRQMVSDVPMGTFLSGGLDSSLISAVCASKTERPLQTFSLDYLNNEKFFVPGKFQPNSDNSYIAQMRDYLGAEHHWTVLGIEDLLQVLQDATVARDLPGMADVDFSLLTFCKDIRKNVKMALSGECADEIFGGYPWYTDPMICSAEGFPWAQNTQLRSSFMAEHIRSKIDGAEYVTEHYRKTVEESDVLPTASPEERRMKEMINLNMNWFMQTLLDRKDRMSMFCGLEVRVPFCDYRIAEYLYGVPWDYKYHQGKEKGLLRYAMAQWLPESVLYRKKSPYPKTWDPSYRDKIREMLQILLNKKDAKIFSIVDKNAVQKLLDEELTQPWYGQLMRAPQTMAYMLQMEYWLTEYQVILNDGI